jgi:hypothetical protein
VGAGEKRFNPTSYHNGSVWPHDNALFALLQACLGLEIDAASAIVLLRRPRLPEFLDWLRVRDLAVGASRLDVLFQRQEGSIGVNLLRREGNAEVDVLL